MSNYAQQIEFLLSENEAAALGTATVYLAGTTTLATIWTTRDKGTTANNPFDLDSRGTAQLYADGVVKVVVKDSAGTTLYTRDNVTYGLQDGPWVDVSSYASLTAAVTAIGSTETNLLINSSTTITGNTTIPATLRVMGGKAGDISIGAYTLTVNSDFEPSGCTITGTTGAATFNAHFAAGMQQVFFGGITVSFAKSLPVIIPQWFGIVPDTGADLTAGFTMLNACISGSHGAEVVFTEGVYKTSTGYWVNGYGVNTRGVGKVIIEPPDGGSNYILMVGNRESGSLSTSIRLASSMSAGDTTAVLTDASGYSVGSVVCIFSGKSANSTAGNRIPLYKQFFTITAIDTGTNTLTFSSQAEVDFLTDADDTVTAAILLPTSTPAVGGRIENIHFRNNSTFTGPYLHGIFYAFNFTLENVRLDGYSSCGYASFCDQMTYRNVQFTGYNGMSCAAGTKKMVYDSCTYNNGQLAENVGGFFEETPEKVYLNNCTINAKVTISNSSDATPAKQFIARDTTFRAPGIAVVISGFYNSGGYAIDMDNCVFDAPGAASAASGGARKAVIDARFFDSIRITNSEFKNADADSYAIEAGNIGTIVSNLHGNRYGSSLGPHSSAQDNVNPLYSTGTFTPVLSLGGAAVGQVAEWAIGTYTRHGNLVFFTISLKLSELGSSTGDATITGLPFTSKNTTNHAFAVSILVDDVAAGLTEYIQATINPNASHIRLGKLTSGQYAELTHASFTDTSLIQITSQYEIAGT